MMYSGGKITRFAFQIMMIFTLIFNSFYMEKEDEKKKLMD